MKVPQVRTNQSVGNVTLAGVKKTGDDFGGQLAEPLAAAGKSIQAFALKEVQSANIAAVQDAESQLYQFENDSLYGDNGLYSRKGKDAMGASDELLNGFDAYSAKVIESLTNDQQRAAFKKSLDSRRRDLLGLSSRYQLSELQTYKANQSAAYVANSQIAASNNYTNNARVSEEIARQVDSIRATSSANGTSPELTSLNIKTAISNTHGNVLGRYLTDKNYVGAKAYFEKNKENLLPKQRAALKKQVEIGDVRAKSQFQTDTILATGVDEKTALSEARKISDPEVRDQTVTRIKTRYAEVNSQKKEFEFQNFSDAANIVEQTGNSSDVPPDMWEGLTLPQRNALDSRAKQLSANEPPKTNWKVWSKLNEMPSNELASINMMEYRSQLSDTHFQQFSIEQQAIKAKIADGKKNPQLSSTLTFKDRSKQTAVGAGIIPSKKTSTKWSEDEALRYGNFQTEAALRIEAFEYEKGAKSTGGEQQKILDEMVIESVRIKRWGEDPELYTYEVTQDLKGNSYVPFSEIPKSEIESARNLIKSRGVSATKSRIERIYAAMLLGDKAMADQILEGN